MQKDNLKFKIVPVLASIIFIVALSIFIFRPSGNEREGEVLDGFAQCLTEKGFKMYGAYWCPHCQNEKKAFGESFQYVNYVECTEEPKQCTDAQVKGYPTWTGPNNIRLEGEQGLEKLAKASGCSLQETVTNDR